MAQEQNEAHLQRVIPLSLYTLYGLGTLIGAGIYVLIGKVSSYAGLYAPISFIVAAIVATFSAFSYAELCGRMPKAAGEAEYVQKAFNVRSFSVLIGIFVIFTGIISAATMVHGFIGYLHQFIDFPDWLAIVLLVAAMGGVSAYGVFESVLLASIITVIEILGLIIVLVLCRENFAELPSQWHSLIPPLDFGIAWQICLGAFLAFYAYIGFEDMVKLAEEVKDPQKNLPKGIILVLILATLLYVLVSVVAVLALPQGKLASSHAPLADIISQHGAIYGKIISLISLVAILNGVLVQVIMASRIIYGMCIEHKSWAWFAKISPKTQTPINSTVLVSLVILGFALWLPLLTLANLSSLIILIVFAVINMSLIMIKLKGHENQSSFSVPSIIPWFGFIFCSILICARLFSPHSF